MIDITDHDQIRQILRDNKFKVIKGGAFTSKIYYKLLVFRFIEPDIFSVDVAVEGTRLEKIKYTDSVARFCISASEAKWKLVEGKIIMEKDKQTSVYRVVDYNGKNQIWEIGYKTKLEAI